MESELGEVKPKIELDGRVIRMTDSIWHYLEVDFVVWLAQNLWLGSEVYPLMTVAQYMISWWLLPMRCSSLFREI